MPTATFVLASAAGLRRGPAASAATPRRAPAMRAAAPGPALPPPPPHIAALLAKLHDGVGLGGAVPPQALSSSPPPPLSPPRELAPEHTGASVARTLARSSPHAAALYADPPDAGDAAADLDAAAAAIFAGPAAPPPLPRAAHVALTLDDASVRSLALLDGDLVDDADTGADAGGGAGQGAGVDALETARGRVLERRRRASEVAARNQNPAANKEAAGEEREDEKAAALNALQLMARPPPPPPGQGRVYTASTPGGATVALPFRPAVAAEHRRAREAGAQHQALFRAVEHVPLAMDGAPLCARCERPTKQDELDANTPGICSPCYASIHYVRASVATLGDQDVAARFRDPDQRAEVKEMEDRTTDAARAVTSALIAKRQGPAAAAAAAAAVSAVATAAALRDSTWTAIAATAATTAATTASTTASTTAAGSRTGTGGAELTREGAVGSGRGAEGAAGAGAGGESGTGSTTAGRGEARGWNVKASKRSMRTINPIRQLVQGIAGEPNPDKELIDLSVGDPTRYGNLAVSDEIVEEFCSVVRAGKSNGYTQSMGSVDARRAVAARYSIPGVAPLEEVDVVLTAGVSGALEMALGALANEGDNVLLPKPGFPLFKTMLDGFGVEARYYSVLPERGWEIKVDDLVAQADDRTAAIVINNPSNPCGSVYSAAHIEAILAAASQLKLPIVADEVYADMVFSGEQFTPIASLPSDVPVLSVGGASKQFVVPGWRAGWLLIHDRGGVLEAGGVRTGVRQLSTRMLMTNAPVQAVLPAMLAEGAAAPAFTRLMEDLERGARATMDGLAGCSGVTCVPPQGSMYLMAKVDVAALGFEDDLAFTKALRAEESVFVLPGQCFLAPNYVRIVFCAPLDVLGDATGRIKEFCARRAAATATAR